VPGNVIADNVQLLGSATHPQFLQYQVEYGPDPNPGNLWLPITGVQRTPVINGIFGVWNTTTANDGLYQIRLRVTLRDGTNLVTVNNNIRVQNRQPTPVPTATTIPRPIAAFSQTATEGIAPLVVNFINQSQGEITSYTWSFSDGGSSTEINPTYTFRNPGVYTVTLTATGPGGSSNVSRQISVQSQTPPVASFTQNVTSGESPLTVNFQDTSQGNITTRTWNFGDGTTGTELNPSYTFDVVGTYNVLLTVSGPGGTSTAVRQITVENPAVPPPSAEFAADVTQGNAPLTVNFSVNETANIDEYNWTFGEAGSSNDASPQVVFSEPGTYTAALTAVGEGGQDTAEVQIVVEQAPDAPNISIATNPSEGDVPLSTQFSVESTGGGITSYLWTFGDGNTSTDASPAHTYQDAGSYNVLLEVQGPGGTDSAETSITALEPLAPPDANFATELVNDGTFLSVQFTNQSDGDELTYSWDFGDGTTSTDASPIHTYSAFGTYEVTFTATNAVGSSTVSQQLLIEPPLAAVINVDTNNGIAPLTVSLDGNNSTGDIQSYAWDFGDGTTDAGANVQKIYETPGSYTVTLTVTDPGGATSQATQNVTVTAGLQAAVSADVTSGTAPLTVNFDGSGSTGEVTAYTWDFGDGTTDTGATVQKIYNAAGSYTVTLTVADASGATSQITQAIEVGAGLQAAVSADVTSGTAPLTVNFDGSGSTGTISSFSWDFGDGGTSAEINPVYTYNTVGEYTVTLTVSDVGGTTSQVTITVSVIAPAPPPADPAIVFVSERDGNRELYLMNADGSNQNRLTNSPNTDEHPDWSRNDEIVFSSSSELFIIGVDGSNLRAISTDDGATAQTGIFPSWAPNATQIVFTSEQDGNREIYVVNADGSGLTNLTNSSVEDMQPAWSPDGNRIVFVSDRDGNREIYVMNIDGNSVTRLTTSDAPDVHPVWSPDGSRIAFASERDGNREVYVMNADGSNPVRLTDNGAHDSQPSWIADGSQILFGSERDGNREVYVMNADGSNPVRLTDNSAVDIQPMAKP